MARRSRDGRVNRVWFYLNTTFQVTPSDNPSVSFADSSPAGGAIEGTDCHTSDIGHWFAMTDGSPGRTKGPLVKRGLAKISDFGLGDCFAGTRGRFCRLLVPS